MSGFLWIAASVAGVMLWSVAALAGPLPPDATYRPLPTQPFDQVKADDEAAKPQVLQRQRALLDGRYDLSNRPMPGVMMSGGRKHVQDGVRVKAARWRDLGRARFDEPRRDPRA